jgi:hypothetical protein
VKIRLIEYLAVLSIGAAIILPFVRKEAIRNHLPEILAGLSTLIVVLLIFHQRLVNGFWFRWYDSWHHEAVEACFVALAIGMLLGKYLGRR